MTSLLSETETETWLLLSFVEEGRDEGEGFWCMDTAAYDAQMEFIDNKNKEKKRGWRDSAVFSSFSVFALVVGP